jgi:L-alanine-DL-glutamate epimerase-like enolase superfamily enzyme
VAKPTDIRPAAARLYFLPIQTRVPLKFGPETTTQITCARVCLTVEDAQGRRASGWGETPLSVQWVWPSALPYAEREAVLKDFCVRLASAWGQFDQRGHPMEVGHDFQIHVLPTLLAEVNRSRCTATSKNEPARGDWPGASADRAEKGRQPAHLLQPAFPQMPPASRLPPEAASAPGTGPSASAAEPLPWLAALVCCSAFDLALHDAFGQLHQRPVYTTYNRDFLSRDLADFFAEAPPASPAGARVERGEAPWFRGRFPEDFLVRPPPARLPAWHLVGGLDPLDPSELTGREPDDGFPVLLADWIRRDGLRCLKVKLRGTDAAWDYERLVRVGRLALAHDVWWLAADFNCTVTDPAYVNDVLDRLLREHPRLYALILYVEQPFPYDLEAHPLDVRSVAARKPLFMDESAHDWKLVRLGRALGWSGVALKTCKTQTGALLSLCWAKAHGMPLMVQDLTNPMLAQIPHLLLAAYAGTLQGVETNGMQFYPAASVPEAAVHPGLYTRRDGQVDLTSIRGPGFGYRLEEIRRTLPPPAFASA